jgi:hypothetical protein
LRISHFVENWPRFTRRKIWYSFLLEAVQIMGASVRLEGLGKFKEFSEHMGTRTRDLPTCSMAAQPSTLPRAPNINRSY